jgi:predicted aspartyl protease
MSAVHFEADVSACGDAVVALVDPWGAAALVVTATVAQSAAMRRAAMRARHEER